MELDRRRLRLPAGAADSRSVVRVADRRRTQIEPAVGLDPHRVQQFAVEELEPDDALIRIVLEVLLQQEQVVGQPHLRVVVQDLLHLRQ